MQSTVVKKSLVIVDRTPDLESVLRPAFSEEILTIRSTGSGQEALRRLAEWKPDLIVSEYLTDDLDGDITTRNCQRKRD